MWCCEVDFANQHRTPWAWHKGTGCPSGYGHGGLLLGFLLLAHKTPRTSTNETVGGIFFFLIHRFHSICFTRAQDIPKCKIGVGKEKVYMHHPGPTLWECTMVELGWVVTANSTGLCSATRAALLSFPTHPAPFPP
jgi:hypothetical protein